MTLRRLSIAIGLLAAAALVCPPAGAGVIVLTNRAPAKVAFTLVPPDGRQTRHGLERGEVLSLPGATGFTVVIDAGTQPVRRVVQADGVYYFDVADNRLDLFAYPLPGLLRRPPPNAPRAVPAADCTIPVKILVDEKEPTVQRVWEKRYRDRLTAATEIIRRACRVQFEVVAVGTWKSDDAVRELPQLMADFERKVRPAPARLAIGFTGQFRALRGDARMGETRDPFHSHILIREWGQQVGDAERLEMLVHELGHFLGAAHSAEPQSVMRPDIGDRQSRARAFRIGFDAPNTLALCLVGEELRGRPLTHLGQLAPDTRGQLRAIYGALAATLPADPAAPRYLMLLDQAR